MRPPFDWVEEERQRTYVTALPACHCGQLPDADGACPQCDCCPYCGAPPLAACDCYERDEDYWSDYYQWAQENPRQ